MASLASTSRPGLCEQRAGEELAVLLFIEPGALDIEEPQFRQARKRQRVEGELRDRLIRPGVRLVVEDMDGAIAHLEEVDMAGEDARGNSFGQELNTVLNLKRVDGRAPSTKSEFQRRL